MKTRLFFMLVSLITVLLPGCGTVLVQKPAGDKPAELDPRIWEGSWIGSDGMTFTTKVLKDAGTIEVRSTTPGEEEEVSHVQVRELKDRHIGTVLPNPGEEKDEEGLAFYRIVTTENHIAVFMPVEDIFKKAVKAGTILGKVKEAKKQPQGPSNTVNLDHDVTSLEQFGVAELDKLPLAVKGALLECFDPDPALVFVRAKEPEKGGEEGGTKK